MRDWEYFLFNEWISEVRVTIFNLKKNRCAQRDIYKDKF